MKTVLITGSAGLIGSEAVRFLSGKMDRVIGIDNDMRAYFFGAEATVKPVSGWLQKNIPNYFHHNTDIRDYGTMEAIFQDYSSDISLIIHAAAQPGHDWAAKEPATDFTVNANGTLNLLELCRKHCPRAVFIFTSTNKVYGDTPNQIPLQEKETRWEPDPSHPYYSRGIDETMSIDHSTHSLFGASKLSADILAQEYGNYFGMHTGVFRCGCVTGPHHAGTELHGFLSYLAKCTVQNRPYTIFGYKGKQVRDNIHAFDLVNMFWHYYKSPRKGEVYNAGGSRFANCSVLEAISLCEEITGNKLFYSRSDQNRKGDHRWYISDLSKFRAHYPDWEYTYDLRSMLTEIVQFEKQTICEVKPGHSRL